MLTKSKSYLGATARGGLSLYFCGVRWDRHDEDGGQRRQDCPRNDDAVDDDGDVEDDAEEANGCARHRARLERYT
jgi:hypothetical protein